MPLIQTHVNLEPSNQGWELKDGYAEADDGTKVNVTYLFIYSDNSTTTVTFSEESMRKLHDDLASRLPARDDPAADLVVAHDMPNLRSV